MGLSRSIPPAALSTEKCSQWHSTPSADSCTWVFPRRRRIQRVSASSRRSRYWRPPILPCLRAFPRRAHGSCIRRRRSSSPIRFIRLLHKQVFHPRPSPPPPSLHRPPSPTPPL